MIASVRTPPRPSCGRRPSRRALALAFSLLLLASGSRATGEKAPSTPLALISPETWFSSYSLQPEPAGLPAAVQELSRRGFFDAPGRSAQAIGFFSTLFARNPEYVPVWFSTFRPLPARHVRLMAAALWYSGMPEGEDLLRRLSAQSPSEVRSGIALMLAENAVPILHTPVLSESSMNLQWGAFLASGDTRHLDLILGAVGMGIKGVPAGARRLFAAAAETDPRIVPYCRSQYRRQPREVRAFLATFLTDAETASLPPDSARRPVN